VTYCTSKKRDREYKQNTVKEAKTKTPTTIGLCLININVDNRTAKQLHNYRYYTSITQYNLAAKNEQMRDANAIALSPEHLLINPLDAHCCHNDGMAIRHPVPDRVKPSFVIFDIRAF